MAAIRGRGRVRLAGVVVLALLAVGATAVPAQAHADFVSSDPADGAILGQAPAAITLTFSEDLLPDAATISVTDATGAVVVSEAVEPTGTTASLPWPAAADGGSYRVAYRVVSADGHPISGSVVLTVGRSTPEAVPGATEEAEPESGLVANALIVAIGVAVLVLIVAVAIVMVRRRRSSLP